MRPLKLLLLLLLVFFENVYAQTLVPCVVVEKISGARTEYLLSTTPHISFSNNIVTITTTEISVELPVSDINKVYLSETTGVETTIEATKATVKITISNDAITMSGLEANSNVFLYAVDGSQITKQKVLHDGSAIVPFSRQLHGIYILKSNNQSFKIIKK